MRITPILLISLACHLAWSQAADPSITFEVASVKVSPPAGNGPIRVGCPNNPGRITCTNMAMMNLVTMAYGVANYQISHLEFINSERYEISAKIPEGATKEQIKLMWQNLLKERFKLAVHHETKEAQVYELAVAKGGLKIHESVEAPVTPGDTPPAANGPRKPMALGDDGFPDIPPGGMAMMRNVARWRPLKITMPAVASMLGLQLHQPVTDATGLTGKYDFTLSWVTGNGARPLSSETSDADLGPDLIEAIQKQLGLKLEQKKGSIEMLVVDHVEKVPTEN